MTNAGYQKYLEGCSLPVLKSLFTKVFMVPPQSSYNKPDIIEKLVNKFTELNSDEVCCCKEEEPTPVKEKASKKPTTKQKRKPSGTSRRGRIISEIVFNNWDSATLAECLNIENQDWKIPQNKTAIAGTIADLRNKKGWGINIVDKGPNKGLIVVNCK